MGKVLSWVMLAYARVLRTLLTPTFNGSTQCNALRVHHTVVKQNSDDVYLILRSSLHESLRATVTRTTVDSEPLY